MKKHQLLKLAFVVAICSFASTNVHAQTVPQAINYQAEARNAAGTILASRTLGIQAKYHSTTSTGTVSYIETFTVSTNQFGLFSLQLGTGTASTGTFAAVPFSTASIYLEIGMDTTGGSSYVSMGTIQFVSVPYSLTAQTATNDWKTTGNAGTNSGTNFIGTTDTNSLMFKVNSNIAGEINITTDNTAFGYKADSAMSTGNENTAFGEAALKFNTTGSFNVAMGYKALYSNTTGTKTPQ